MVAAMAAVVPAMDPWEEGAMACPPGAPVLHYRPTGMQSLTALHLALSGQALPGAAPHLSLPPLLTWSDLFCR